MIFLTAYTILSRRMDWTQTFEHLARRGLNIFASCRVERLPVELRECLGTAASAQTLCLIAHGGRTLWENLSHPLRSDQHPIDTFTTRLILEAFHDAAFLYPHPFHVPPLQKLGRFLNLARPSMLGLDINEKYGPWFAYRAAFLTSLDIPEISPAPFASPCETCAEKPCLKACEPKAVGVEFNIPRCAGFRFQENSPCADRCLARLACPFREEHRYTLEQMQYHMLRPAHLKKMSAFK